jgi:hypothetical protein
MMYSLSTKAQGGVCNFGYRCVTQRWDGGAVSVSRVTNLRKAPAPWGKAPELDFDVWPIVVASTNKVLPACVLRPPKHAKLEGRRFGSHQDGRKRRRAMEEEEVADLAVLAQYSTCYTLSVFAPTSRADSSGRPRVARIIIPRQSVLQE